MVILLYNQTSVLKFFEDLTLSKVQSSNESPLGLFFLKHKEKKLKLFLIFHTCAGVTAVS